jgi:hypothetical protein
MDGSEFLGDLEGSQGSLLSCSPSATSLDIDGWFSYLAAQEGTSPPLHTNQREIHGKFIRGNMEIIISFY